MSKYIEPEDLGSYIRKMQGKMSMSDMANSLGIFRQNVRALIIGEYRPTPEILAKLNLETMYRVRETGKYILPSGLGKYLAKVQGDVTDSAFCTSVGMTRNTLYFLAKGEKLPIVRTLNNIGLDLVYRVVPKTAPVPAKAAKKK